MLRTCSLGPSLQLFGLLLVLTWTAACTDSPAEPDDSTRPPAGSSAGAPYLPSSTPGAPHPLNANPPNGGMPASGGPGAIIDNGTVQLGVLAEGHLNAPGGPPAAESEATFVGVRFLPTNVDGLSAGCLCEGWGVASAAYRGYANQGLGIQGLTVEAFDVTPTSARSVVLIDGPVAAAFRVTHDFRPSDRTPYLYEVSVRLENTSGENLERVRYRRVADWDVAPNLFAEFVTIQGSDADDLLWTGDAISPADPWMEPEPILFQADEIDSGPFDHGATFELDLGDMAIGEVREFTMFYGAASNEGAALDALANVGAEAYSLGQGNWDGEGDAFSEAASGTYAALTGEPQTFILAFAGIRGTPLVATADLSITTEAAVDRAVVGVPFAFESVIRNLGPNTAEEVTLRIGIGSEGRFIDAVPSAGSCEDRACELGDLAAGDSILVTVNVLPVVAQSVSNVSEVASATDDPDPDNNVSRTSIRPEEAVEADLAVFVTSSTSEPVVEVPFLFVAEAENLGPATAENVEIFVSPPGSEGRLRGVYPSVGACEKPEDSGIYRCDVGTLEPGAAVAVELVVVPVADETIGLRARVSADAPDPDESNNEFRGTVRGVERPIDTVCSIIDFNDLGEHGDDVVSFDLNGETIDIAVEPFGDAGLPVAAIYDTDVVSGPDPDLEWTGGTCDACEGQGKVLVISGDPFDTEGDSGSGGSLIFTGFESRWILRSLRAIDSDEEANPWSVWSDGILGTTTTPGSDGNVQEVGWEIATDVLVPLRSEVRIELLDESGGIDDLVFCPVPG